MTNQLSDSDLELAGFSDGSLDDGAAYPTYSALGLSIDPDDLTDAQRAIYESAYQDGADFEAALNTDDDLDDNDLFGDDDEDDDLFGNDDPNEDEDNFDLFGNPDDEDREDW